jgi:hypothetical protein
MRDFDGVEYLNDGDWVESCTAIVERFDGTFELIRWLGAREGLAAEQKPTREAA